MKNRNIYIIIFALFLSFGCNEKDFLDLTNPNAITTTTFWQTERQFNSALTTVYSALQFQAISGGLLQHEMIRGDIGGSESWYRPTAFRNLTYNDGTYYVTDKWDQAYIGIFRANQVIQYLEDADPSIFSEYKREEIEGQAKFIRAFMYFQIAHTYGGAVMHTRIAETNEDLHKPLSSIDEVTNTIIIPDLEYARANLPQTWDAANTGRITWGAATSMLGKVHLFEENWSQAAALFKEVIDAGIYSLTADIMDNWRHDTEFNSESIFEVAYSAELNPGTSGNATDDTPWFSGSEASSLATAVGHLNFGAFNTLLPSYYLHELFVYDEVDVDNAINDGNLHSKRMTASICPINGESLYYNVPIGERGGWGFGQSSYVKKHANWYHLDAEDNNNRSGINFRHIRLADVFLMYAEAVLEESGDVNTAIEYIDKVRSRAGVITLADYIADNTGQFPQFHRSRQVNGSHQMVDATAENVMTHLRRVERPLELCFEGHRFKDLVRWGIVKEVFDELRAEEEWRETFGPLLNLSGGGVPPLYIVERIRPDFFLAAQNYNADQHDYFPIPTQEKQTNPLID